MSNDMVSRPYSSDIHGSKLSRLCLANATYRRPQGPVQMDETSCVPSSHTSRIIPSPQLFQHLNTLCCPTKPSGCGPVTLSYL